MSNFCYWCQRFYLYYLINGHVFIKLALPSFVLAKHTGVQLFGCMGSGSDGVNLFIVDRDKRIKYEYDFLLKTWDCSQECEDMYL